ncbi:DUF3164 family protein [Paenirhodobacter populi]|uniref:DUF3164 family protein n=1 Tax=Paenirhodobacter populi TaxID=2306993 RepID=UPI001F4DF56C|nr:DUF3164 family protein [Sinirhodobacter populi]
MIDGAEYMRDPKNRLLPVEMIKPQHLLEDQMVRDQFGWILSLVEQISRYRGHLFEDLGEFDALIAEKYGAEKGGPKGNRTYRTVDDCYAISIRVRDTLDFGSELQAAKALIDECLRGWTEDAAAPLRVIVDGAFSIDKEGLINKGEIFKLLRHNITDPKWLQAMDALRDAIRVTGSRTTPEFKMRTAPGEKQISISISLAQ